MARIINKNQRRKVYPRLRKRPVYEQCGGGGVDVETTILTFAGESDVTYTFAKSYPTYHPVVTVVAAGTDNNINLFISNITTTTVTISASTAFHGTAHLVAVARSI